MPTAREVGASFVECIWALAFPIILIIGFRFGFFTVESVATLTFRNLSRWASVSASGIGKNTVGLVGNCQ